MARTLQSGFELNTTTGLVEWSGTGGSPTISSSTFRSGQYALRISSLSSGTRKGLIYNFSGINDANYFYRFYIYIVTYPSAANRIIVANTGTTSLTVGTHIAWIELNSDGTLQLNDEDGSIGSASSVLNTSTWYRIEMQVTRNTGAGDGVVACRIDGAEFASSSTRSLSSPSFNAVSVGGNLNAEAQTQGEWFFDDLAVNNTSGSFQTSYPGSGKIIHLKPNAAGDSNTFATQVGGTAGSSNNFTRVSEITPDDSTTYNASSVATEEDLFNVENSGIGASDTINVVGIGGRFANLVGADATTAFRFEVIKTSGGTKSQSSSIVPNSTSWRTNFPSPDSNMSNRLIRYQDPDNVDWTQSTLDSMQIGYILQTANVRAIAVSTVWASVDYTPAAGTARTKSLTLLNVS